MACKDLHDSPLGISFRRVYQVVWEMDRGRKRADAGGRGELFFVPCLRTLRETGLSCRLSERSDSKERNRRGLDRLQPVRCLPDLH